MSSDRKKTLETLLELAVADDPTGCWDPARARDLLRTQSGRAELETLGADESLLDELWPESDER
jgi:hypothetical protein